MVDDDFHYEVLYCVECFLILTINKLTYGKAF